MTPEPGDWHLDPLRGEWPVEWSLKFYLPQFSVIHCGNCGQSSGKKKKGYCVFCNEFVVISFIEESVVKVHRAVQSKGKVTSNLPKTVCTLSSDYVHWTLS